MMFYNKWVEQFSQHGDFSTKQKKTFAYKHGIKSKVG